VADQSIGTNGKVSQAIDRKAEKGRLRCRREDERVTTAGSSSRKTKGYLEGKKH
jgi:hypothetical protein